MPKVSLVVATYNEQDNIATLLASCRSQSYPRLEIIVVDSQNSTDNTYKLARQFTSRVYRHGQERSVQRNFGVAKATGRYILVLDADMKLDPDVVSQCVDQAQTSKHRALIVPETSYGQGYWAKCKALERNCYLGDPSIEAPRFFLRSDFLKLGGYNPRMVSGEDWDLARRFRLSGSVGRVSAFIHHNEGRISLLKTLHKKFYYSRTSAPYLESNLRGVGDVFLFIFRPAFLRSWRTLLADPIHLPGMLLMKSLEFGAGALAIVTQAVFWRKILKRA